ncbi:MAG: Na+/H+ antiporter subunit E [Pseudomonadota bacterium]
MATILINVLFALAWCAVTGTFSALNLAFGFVLGGITLIVIRDQIGAITHFRRFLGSVALAVSFLTELIKSSVNVAIIVLSPGRKLKPAIIAFPLDVKSPAEITLLANLITLTPGTLSMDVSEDQSTLYIHAIDAADPTEVINDIKTGFERRIKEVFNP